MYIAIEKRLDPVVEKDRSALSSTTTEQPTRYIMCSKDDQATIGYKCESRPLMTGLLVLSIVILVILRKSSFIKNYVAANREKLQEQSEEEEGLMQRVGLTIKEFYNRKLNSM